MIKNLLLCCFFLTCLVGCPAIENGSDTDNLTPEQTAKQSIVTYSKLLAETFDDAAMKLEINEFKTTRDFGEFVTDKNKKARDVCFEKIRELLQEEFGEAQEDFDKQKLIELSREISTGLKQVN